MQAGATTIKLMADIADIQRKFNLVAQQAQATADKVGRAFDALGLQIGAALSVGGLTAWVKSAINAADEMSKLAQKTGVAVKDVAGLQLAFRQSGVAAEQMVPIMAKLGVAIANGNDALKAMGIASRNADGSLKSTRQVLGEVSTAFASYQDGAAKTALAVKLFGEEGAKLMPLLNGGAAALDDFDTKAKQLGLTLDDQTAKAAERFNDQLDLVLLRAQGIGRELAGTLLPVLEELATTLANSARSGGAFKVAGDALAIVLETLIVLGSDVAFVFRGIWREISTIGQQIKAFFMAEDIAEAGRLWSEIRNKAISDAQTDRAQLDAFQRRILSARELSDIVAKAADYDEPRYRRALQQTTDAQKAQAPVIERITDAINKKKNAADEALKASIEAAKYANAQWDEEFKRIEAQREATEKRIRDGREMLEQIEFETRLLGMNATEREVATAMRELERNGIVEGTEAYKAYAKAIREAIANREAVKASQDLRKQELDAWQKHWDQVSESFVDALMQGGKSVAEYLKGLFRTLVLRPILAPIGGAFAGMFGGPASAGSLMGGGATGGTFNILSAAKSAYDAIAGGFASLGNSVAFAADSMGAWLVNNTSGVLNKMGGSLMQSAGSLGTAASYLGGAAAGLALGQIISGGYSAIGKSGNTANIAGTAIGAIFGGPIGAAIGGAIGGLFNRAFGRKAPVTTGSGITGTFSTDGANVQNYQEWFQKGGWFRSNKSGVNYSAVSSELDQFLDGSLKQVTMATRMYANVLGLNANAINGITQSVRISLMGLSAEQQQQAITDALASFADVLASQFVRGRFIQAGERASDALARMANSLVTVNQVLDTLNQTLLQSTLVGGDAASKLVDAFGGADAFVQGTTAYYQAFYSDAERAATATRQLTEVMAGMGLELPRTRAEFRALVESQDLYTESGRQTYAALIRLAPAFDEIQKATESFTDAFRDEMGRLMDSLLNAVAGARQGVADARGSILGRPDVMTAAQIRSGIRAANVGMPTTSAIEAASRDMATQQQIINTTQPLLSEAHSDLAFYTQRLAEAQRDVSSYSASLTTFQRFGIQSAIEYYTRLLSAAQARVAGANSAISSLNTQIADYNTRIANAQTALAQAAASQQTALTAYQQALSAYVIDANRAVDQLNKLRDETVKYYEAQAELANVMIGSAANLRAAVASTRSAQLSASDNLAMRQRDFAMAYSMALATTGTTQAGYADRMAAALPGLSESLRATAATRADWVRATARLYAQSNTVAASLEANAPKNYQAESLAMLNQIDATLAAIESQASSAEKIISDAIYATGNRNIEGLRGVIAAIRGESVPAFAMGGWHSGGVRLVGENGPELEATGPSRIYNAQQTAAMLGGGGAVADEIRALREEVALLRYEARATAVNTSKTHRLLDDVTQGGTTIRTTEVAA